MLLSENVCAFQDPIKEHYNDEKGKRCKLFDIMEGKKFSWYLRMYKKLNLLICDSSIFNKAP